jgi:hypothetical protein
VTLSLLGGGVFVNLIGVDLTVGTRLLHLGDHLILAESAMTESSIGDQTLDLGSLGSSDLVLLSFLLRHDLTSSHGSLDLASLGSSLLDSEKLGDLGGSLRSLTAGGGSISEALNLLSVGVDESQVHDGQIRADNAATDGLALAHTFTALTVALHALGEQEADTRVLKNTLHHRETLLVVASGDLEHHTVEFIADPLAWGNLELEIRVMRNWNLEIQEIRFRE